MITKFQLSLMAHAVGDSNRNWFATSFNTKESKQFELLVDSGHASKCKAPSWSGDEVVYSVTSKGMESLRTINNE